MCVCSVCMPYLFRVQCASQWSCLTAERRVHKDGHLHLLSTAAYLAALFVSTNTYFPTAHLSLKCISFSRTHLSLQHTLSYYSSLQNTYPCNIPSIATPLLTTSHPLTIRISPTPYVSLQLVYNNFLPITSYPCVMLGTTPAYLQRLSVCTSLHDTFPEAIVLLSFLFVVSKDVV